MRQGPQFVAADDGQGDEADKEKDGAKEAKDVHGLLAEIAQEPKRDKVQVTIEKAVEPELGTAIFTGLVVHHLLPYAVKARVLGQVRDVSVHLSVDLYVFHHLPAIGFQAAIEVVQVVDAADFAGGSVEKLGRDGFGERVVTLLLIPGNQVILLFHDHVIESGYLVGRVLQVRVHGDDHVAAGFLEAAIERRALSVVAAKLDAFHLLPLLGKLLYHVPRVIGGAVVDENHLIGIVVLLHHSLYPAEKLGQ